MLSEQDAGNMRPVQRRHAILMVSRSQGRGDFDVRPAEAGMGELDRTVEHGNANAGIPERPLPKRLEFGFERQNPGICLLVNPLAHGATVYGVNRVWSINQRSDLGALH